MWERIFTILRKEFRSVFRDPRMRMVILGLPVIQTLIFGYAVTLDVRHVQLVVIDRDQTPASRAFVARFTGSGLFDAALWTQDERAAQREIDAARASAILELDAGFAATLDAGRAPVFKYVFRSMSFTSLMLSPQSVLNKPRNVNPAFVDNHVSHSRLFLF